jgi:uncharacterized integral membrane protein
MAQQDPSAGRRSRAGIGGGAIATIIGVALIVIFIVQNTEKIRLHFLAWHFTWSLWLYTIVVAAFGALVWLGLGVMRRHRRRQRRRGEVD